jgi:hypothetical protein
MRLLALSEALTGFGFISLAVTYLVSLTAALERKRAVALFFYHQARQGADVAGLLINHFVCGRFVGVENIFAGAARDLQGLLESHIEHPLIHYFHPIHVHKSLPRMLFLVLEACAVTRACLDNQAYEELCRHPELRTLEETSRHVLTELATTVGVIRGTAIAKTNRGARGCPPSKSLCAGASVTRLQCAGCGTQRCFCPRTRCPRTTAPSSPAVFGPCVLIRENPFIGG